MSEAVREAIWEKADFCLKTGVQPSEYDQLTDLERDVFIERANALHKEK